jgi:hypothetical protein
MIVVPLKCKIAILTRAKFNHELDTQLFAKFDIYVCRDQCLSKGMRVTIPFEIDLKQAILVLVMCLMFISLQVSSIIFKILGRAA